MKAVLLSLKPEWWEKILNREKTMEIRKNVPHIGENETGQWPMRVLVYVCGTGEVRGEFECPGWVKTNFLEYLVGPSCVSLEQLKKYAGGSRNQLCGWIVRNPKAFEEIHPLAEFGLTNPPMSWQYIELQEENG